MRTPAASPLFIGIDCSTSACKASSYDLRGNLVSSGRAEIPLAQPQTGWREQNPPDWWQALCTALQTCTQTINPASVRGIALSVQRETFVVMDRNHNPLRPAILWMDTRANAEVEALQPLLPDFHQHTGKRLSVNLIPPKLRWLVVHEPQTFENIAQVWDVHAYLSARLTGEAVASWGSAGPTGLLDLRSMQWYEPVLEACCITTEQLPHLVAPGEYIGSLSPQTAQATGLTAGTAVYAGIGDGQAGGIGAGITTPGRSYLTLGTSVISGTFAPQFVTSDAFRSMVGGSRSTYLLETVLLSGTYILDWYLNTLLSSASDHTALSVQAASLPPGSEGLVVLPYWNSALNPYWDADARGVILGWRGSHTPAHVYRAILEGIAFEQRLHTDGVADALDAPIDRYFIMGGGARSNLWCQIIADISGREVVRTAVSETAALGAAMLAAVGSGALPDLDTAAQQMSRVASEVFHPQTAAQAQYERLYQQVYRPLYPAIRELNRHLSRLCG
jgi:xylulokinase